MEPQKESVPPPPKPEPRKVQQSVSFAIEKNDLLAMRLLQSKDESRYVLNGVHFEVNPDGRVLMIATNGRYIGILRPSVMQSEPVTEPVRFTVNYPLVKYLPADKGLLGGKIILHYSGEKQRITFRSAGDETVCEEILGFFPRWRDVIPKTPFAPFEISINARYVSEFERVAKLLDGTRGEQIVIKGHKPTTEDPLAAPPYSVFIPGLVDKQFFGVIMPMLPPKVEAPTDWLREWKQPEQTQTKTVAPEEFKDTSHVTPAVAAKTPTPIPADAKPESPYGKTFIGTSEGGFTPIAQPGYSLWIESGRWYTAPTVDPKKFDLETPPPGAPPITYETKVQGHWKIKAPTKRKKHVHRNNTRPRKSLDRSRGSRHRKKRTDLQVHRRGKRGSNRKSSKPTQTTKRG